MIVGFGKTGQAVARALVARDLPVVACDDRADDELRATATAIGVDLVEAPDDDTLRALVDAASEVLPAPGLPDTHPAFALASELGVPVRSELDLANRWDERPVVAVTGTDGKTTVTTLATAMLRASGVAAVAAGNNDLPLVAAIDDPAAEVFVVEASSFRLLHSERFAPAAAAWLNFAPDHLDNHSSLVAYEEAKARIWRDLQPEAVAIGNADDPVVLAHLRRVMARQQTFGLGVTADWTVTDGQLRGPGLGAFVAVDELPRNFEHDLANALAAAAVVAPVGATAAGIADALRAFHGLPHRLELVVESDRVRWYDSSKATTPHAALNDASVVGRAVLIAGGRNKGLDLSVLAGAAPSLRAVVAIGEAAPDVVATFDGVVPVATAGSMAEAVTLARGYAQPGDAVVLAPGCASYDWYASYGDRGDDFARRVREVISA